MSGRRALSLVPIFLQPACRAEGAANRLFLLQALGSGCSRPWLGGVQTRSSSSEACEDASTSSISVTKEVLQQTRVLKLREELEQEAERSPHIPYKQLIALVKDSGAADSDKDAEEVCAALHRSGVVLRHRHKVFLRPQEIAETVMQALPGGSEDLEKELKVVELELKELDQQHERIDRHAHKTARRLLVGGYFILAFQFVGFIWGTWYEFSWDVMEPLGYIISLFYTLVGYTYFLATKGGVFDLGPFRESWHSHFKKKKATAVKFDEERYRHLLQLKERYTRQLARAALRR